MLSYRAIIEVMEPKLIFDKSFIQMIDDEELFELRIFFDLLGIPVIRREILADLQKEPKKGRDHLAIMKSLSVKMSKTALAPMDYRRAAIHDLGMIRKAIPMNGAVPIDINAPHVTRTGGGVHIDHRQLQWDWRRWAQGQFTPEEMRLAREHHDVLAAWSPDRYCEQWREMHANHFVEFTTLDSVIHFVDDLLDSYDYSKQELVLALTFTNLWVPDNIAGFVTLLFRAKLISRLKDYSPYTASVTRLWMVYQIALGRGLIGRRRSDVIDLEYLFYAPFCHVFVTNDRLQKEFWKATTTNAQLCDGAELKADLKNRAMLRKEDPKRVSGRIPLPIEGSIINELFRNFKKAQAARRTRSNR
jgi:hypothetical protein